MPLPSQLRPDISEIREALKALGEPGQVFELRVLNTSQGTVSGYFDDLDNLAAVAAAHSGRAPSVYPTQSEMKKQVVASVASLSTASPTSQPPASVTWIWDRALCRDLLADHSECWRHFQVVIYLSRFGTYALAKKLAIPFV